MVDRIELTTVEGESGLPRAERADAAANRQLILATAERLFAERGVEAVCMSEIAEAAGVGKGTLYRRFANKAELCLALMDTQMASFQNSTLLAFQELTDRGASHLAQLDTFLDALVNFTEVHSPLLVEVERGGMFRADLRLRLPHEWQYMTVNALLSAAARKGEIDSRLDLEYLADALLAPLQVDVFRYQRIVRGFSLERISAGLRGIVDALAAHPGA
jgi:AcrR family transcriptional regulator